MIVFAGAVLSPPEGRLGDAIALTLVPRAKGPGAEIGLGWLLHAGLALHCGGTAGFTPEVAINRSSSRCAVGVVNMGGFDLCEAITMQAALGGDPLSVVPTPLDRDEAEPWVRVATAVTRSLIAADFDHARGLMRKAAAEALSEERLRTAWTSVIGPLGELQEPVVVSVARRNGAVEAILLSTSTSEPPRALRTTVSLDEEKQVAGIHIR